MLFGDPPRIGLRLAELEFISVENDFIFISQYQVVKRVIEGVLYIFVELKGVVENFYFVRDIFDCFVIPTCVGVAKC